MSFQFWFMKSDSSLFWSFLKINTPIASSSGKTRNETKQIQKAIKALIVYVAYIATFTAI